MGNTWFSPAATAATAAPAATAATVTETVATPDATTPDATTNTETEHEPEPEETLRQLMARLRRQARMRRHQAELDLRNQFFRTAGDDPDRPVRSAYMCLSKFVWDDRLGRYVVHDD